MKANYRAAASAGLLLSACANVGHAATTVQTVVGPQAASSNFDVLFSTPLTSVTQLVSISDGSVNTGEGAAFSISAILTNNQVVQIFSASPPPPFFQTPSLAAFTGNVFTPFGTPQDVKALRFTSTGFPAGTFALPALTVLTFTVVPEPAAALLMVLGFVFLAFRHRRQIA
ncbi:MAG: PEP-CTERM sorting domain-containing protein [Luteolibacter sp.]|uniref:PEP-CTERM sorting domain-containing protein n=1 Tax=Luteolibacter sp. TaxID=1962973 RepID=UPI003264E190